MDLYSQKNYNQQAKLKQKEISFIEPLLKMYDNQIANMNKLLEETNLNIQEQDNRMFVLIEENSFLRKELNDKCLYIQNNIQDPTKKFCQLEFEQIQLNLADQQETNQLMEQQITEFREKFEELTQVNLETSMTVSTLNNQISSSSGQIQKLQSDNKVLTLKLQESSDYTEVLENKLKNLSSQQQELVENQESSQSQYQLIINENRVLNNKNKQLDDYIEELQEQKQGEISFAVKEIEILKLKEKDLLNQLVQLEQETDALREENRRQLTEVNQLKTDQESMLQMIDNYEKKTNMIQEKENQMLKIQKEQRQELHEAIVLKDKALIKEQKLQKMLDGLNVDNQIELKEQAKQSQQVMNILKQKQQHQTNNFENQIKGLEETVQKQENQVNKLTKDKQQAENEYNKLKGLLTDKIGGVQIDAQEYESKISVLEEKLSLEKQSAFDREQEQKEEYNQLEKKVSSQNQEILKITLSNDNLKNQNQRIQQDLRNQTADNANLILEKTQISDELQRYRNLCQTKLDQTDMNYRDKLQSEKEKLFKSLKYEITQKEQLLELVENNEKEHNEEQNMLENYYKNEISSRETYVQELQNELLDIQNINKQLLKQLE